MKPWQRNNDGSPAPEAHKPLPALGALRKLMATSFHLKSRYWQRIGAVQARVCQFCITGEVEDRWYVAIDAAGARVLAGVHPAPSATWTSDADAFRRLMGGQRDLGLLAQGRVRLAGEHGHLLELFRALQR